ncbi:MAG: DUF126 domain-containing protein [Candidatus Nitrosocaldus sp.]|nr:DUF126 domain-containing protein [Candidatus Nitrosocaldus sp.]MDW7999778.1 DUF126 domain-containing protein [Candidatus Nitrosocaldus sp.]
MNAFRYSIPCKGIVKGYAEGHALVSREPINLLSIDAQGRINDSTHTLNGRSVSGTILVFPNAVGSSVGAYRLYAAKVNGNAPRAVVCARADIITASACAISNIPLVECNEHYGRLIELCSKDNGYGDGGDDGVIIAVDATNALITIGK